MDDKSLKVLQYIWGTQKSGYVFIPRKKGKVWEEGRGFKYPEELDAIVSRIKHSSEYDLYWCPFVFNTPQRIKEYVTSDLKFLWADLDEVDPRKLAGVKPTIAWASSDESYQGLWLLDNTHAPEKVESINKRLTYMLGADKSGWDVTQLLRVPGTKNYKYEPVQEGKLLWVDKYAIYNLDKLETLTEDTDVEDDLSDLSIEELIELYPVPKRIKEFLLMPESEVKVGERSDRLWEIEVSLLEAGMSVLDVVKVVDKCPWNKFKDRRDGINQIYKEVIKAESHVKKKTRAKKVGEEITETSSWAVPFSKFSRKKLRKPEWLVENIWQEGTYGMIAGEPKTYKSIQATDLALSITTGIPFLGRYKVNKTGAVMYIQEENNEQTIQDRLFKIAHEKGVLSSSATEWSLPPEIPLYLSNNTGIDLTTEESRARIEQSINEIRPLLIIFDPLYMMMGNVDENSATEVSDILKWLTSLRNKYGTGVLICHHYKKASGDTRGGQRIRGTSSFHAWVESALYVKTTKTEHTVKLEREFRAFQAIGDIELTFELGEPGELYYKVIVDDTKTESKNTKSEICKEDIMNTLAKSPRTFGELKTITGITRRALRKYLDELIIDKYVLKDGDETGGRGHSVSYVAVKFDD